MPEIKNGKFFLLFKGRLTRTDKWVKSPARLGQTAKLGQMPHLKSVLANPVLGQVVPRRTGRKTVEERGRPEGVTARAGKCIRDEPLLVLLEH